MNFVGFFGDLKTPKIYFEVKWPLMSPKRKNLPLKIFWLERYLSYCHSERAKTLCTPKNAKLLIALVGLFSLIYNIPAYCENKYENINGTIRSAQTYLANHELYKLIYRAWIGFIVRFVIPTICLVVFNVKIIRKVSYRKDKVHIFWEGHKFLRNLHLTFDWHYIGQK